MGDLKSRKVKDLVTQTQATEGREGGGQVEVPFQALGANPGVGFKRDQTNPATDNILKIKGLARPECHHSAGPAVGNDRSAQVLTVC